MEIQILQLIEGARAARGTAVIIDVFRAFTVEPYLIRAGAERIIPVGDEARARAYKAKYPDTVLLCGERGGRMLPGFDFGNSPSQIEGSDLRGKTVVHTTSAGTQGIANAIEAQEILGGSLVNAAATAEYLRRRDPAVVSLVCMGLDGLEETDEDTLCALYLKSLLEGHPLPDLQARMENLRCTSGAKFFDPAQAEVFPQRDFELCIQADSCPFALRLHRPETGPAYMEPINIL